MTQTTNADVLIVGAGPAGLCLATELTMRGHLVEVVERNSDTGVQPRAKTTNVRSMTHMRRWGLATKVRDRSPLRPDFPRRVTFQFSPFDAPVFTFEDAFCSTPGQRDAFPEHAEFIPQYVIGRILGEHVAHHPLANIHFDSTLTSFENHVDHVSAEIETPEGSRTINAKYLVGADGARSTVRKTLGIKMSGKSDIAKLTTLILRIPGLNEDPDLHPALFHWIVNPDAPSFFGPMDVNDLWFFGTSSDHGTDTDELLALAHRTIGRDTHSVELVTRDDWTVHSLIADSYRKGHTFLIGDACHLHSPFGGHGMNLGIADAADLGWKLSAALDGWGGDGLLDSYAIERRQAHEAVIESATKNVATLSEHYANPALAESGPEGDAARARAAKAIEVDKSPEFRSLGLVLGYRYQGSPAIAVSDQLSPPIDVTNYVPCALPGHLAPHAWIDEATSLYDLFGQGYTLLDFTEDDDVRELVSVAKAAGVPFKVQPLTSPRIAAIYGTRFALIRPDQHVAWCGNAIQDPSHLVDLMRGQVRVEQSATA